MAANIARAITPPWSGRLIGAAAASFARRAASRYAGGERDSRPRVALALTSLLLAAFISVGITLAEDLLRFDCRTSALRLDDAKIGAVS